MLGLGLLLLVDTRSERVVQPWPSREMGRGKKHRWRYSSVWFGRVV
jgi:hypothetical protein